MGQATATAARARFLAVALSVLAGGLCWSFTGVFVRLAPHLDSWQFLVFRGLGVAVAFRLIGGRSAMAALRRPDALGLLTAAALSVAAIGFIVALKMTSVATALFLSSCAPLLSALLGYWILGERSTGARSARWRSASAAWRSSSAAGFEADGSPAISVGLACALSLRDRQRLHAAGAAARFRPGDDRLWGAVRGDLRRGPPQRGATLARRRSRRCRFSPSGLLLIVVGFMLFLRGAPTVPAVGQTMLAQTETIFGPIWVWLFFGETPPATTLLGGAVILAAVVAMAFAGAGAAPAQGRASQASIAARRTRSRRRI